MLSGNTLVKKLGIRKPRAPIAALGFAALLLVSVIPAPAAAAEPAALPPLGMSVGSISGLTAAGAPPRYGSYWVGDWMADSGWGGFDNAMRTAKASGVTPVVYWYYWGDSISPGCFDSDGCNGRTEAEWNKLTDELVSRLRSTLDGSEALVVLENEFNKGGITGDFAPTFDAKLEKIAIKLKAVSGVKLIVGFGNWGEDSWAKFPKTIAQSEYVGFQMMRASTRDTESEYRGAADRTVVLTNYVAEKFNKPSFLYDVALSSYPDDRWKQIQAETLDAIFANLKSSGATGLQGVVYRSLKDHYMSPANYYGYAESHWGLRTKDDVAKPAFDVWLKHAKGAPSPATPNVPGAFEAESMTATKGGRTSDGGPSGGAAWNLWSNGELSTTLVSDAARKARIEVVALGQQAGGVPPRMEVRLGEAPVGAFDVAPGGYASYVIETDLAAGSTPLAIAFVNDAVVNGEDRNLIVDVVRVTDAAPPAPPANVPGAFEGEDMSATKGGRKSDAAASAGAAWNLWSNGELSTTLVADADRRVDITVVARGEEAAGVAPRMEIRLGGTTLGAFDVPAGAYASYTVTADLPAGSTDVEVAFTNDAVVNGQDRNLIVDVLKVGEAAPPPPPNAPPTASFAASMSDLRAAFDASASNDADGDALAYAWDFGDGSNATGATAIHDYAAGGTYTVTLTVSDGEDAATATKSVTAVQPNRAPVAAAKATGSMDAFTFDASGSSDPDGDALSYAWSLGDGRTATGAKVSHTYAAAGTYTAKVTVTDPKGLSSTASVQVTATKPAPFAATFSGLKGNEWWVQVDVAGNKPVTAVCAMVDGGECRTLTLRSYGWAGSFRVPHGSIVTFRATASTGETVTSGKYVWPEATPYTAPKVTFTPYDGNAHWVQTKVESSTTVKAVCATLNGGSCQKLEHKSWGAWAASLRAPPGTKVVFVATLADGSTVKSATYTWPVK